jgi:DnaJ-class molecular chaperone
MFIDYYAILIIGIEANQSDIKNAFKDQALKWHPDKNPDKDTTLRMQLINEAYLILKDKDARQRYDVEYRKYKKTQEQSQPKKEQSSETQENQNNTNQDDYNHFEDNSHEIMDEILKKWMKNARSQAHLLAKETIDDMIGMSKVGGQAIFQSLLSGVVKYIFFGIIMFIIIKACQK